MPVLNFLSKSLRHGLFNFNCLMTNHATFDTKLDYVWGATCSLKATVIKRHFTLNVVNASDAISNVDISTYSKHL